MRRSLTCFLLFALSLACVSLAWAAPSAADQAFTAARQLFRTENDEQAITELQQFVTTYPKDPRVHEATYLLGCSYQRLRKLPPAQAAFTQVVTRATGTEFARLRADAHFQLGECHAQQEEYEKAAQSYDNALKLVTDDKDFIAQALYLRASCLYQLGRGKDALPIYRKVVETMPEHPLAPWSLYSAGVIEVESGNYTAAITALEDTLARYQTAEVGDDARLKLGFAYLERARAGKDPAAVETDRRKALPLLQALVDNAALAEEMRLQAANMLARGYLDLNDNERAIAVCTQMLARAAAPTQPAVLQLRLARADAYYDAKRFAEAAADYAAAANDKNTPQALYWLGNSRYQLGLANKDKTSFIAAIDSFTAFLKSAGMAKTPLAPRATLLIGLSYEELAGLGDDAARLQAVAAFKEVAENWPNTREATEAKVRMTNQANELPVSELEKLAKTLPPGEMLWNVNLRLARETYLAGKYPESLAIAQKLLESKPAPDIAAKAAYLAALALVRLDRGKEAIALYRQVLANPQAGEVKLPAQRGLIQAHLQLKQFTEAREAAKALAEQAIDVKTPAEREIELGDRLILLAQAYAGGGQFPEAAAVYARILKECPSSPQAPFALLGNAWVAEQRKELPAANALYTEFITRFAKHELAGEANFRLGANLLEAKDYEKAITTLQQVPAAHKLADEAGYKIAWAYRGLGKAAEADTQFLRVVDQFPQSPFAGASLFHLGEAAMGGEKFTEAQALLRRALDMMAPDYSLRPHALLKLGACAYEVKDYAGAAAAFGALAANEKAGDLAAEGLFWRAKSQEQQGAEQLPAAREGYQQYAARYPAAGLVLDAQLGAGRTALALQRIAEARADLLKTLELCNQAVPAQAERAKYVQPEARFLLGQAAMSEKLYDDALKQFALVSAFNMEPWYSRSLLQMARCSAVSGNNAAAEKTLALLKKTFPQSDAAKEIPAVAEEYKLTVD